MKLSRREFVTSGATAMTAAAVGLRPARALAQTPKKGGTLRVGFYIEAATMDPHLSGSKVDRQVYHNIYEPLVTLDTKLGIRPGLAESWSQPDPRTLVFKLRRGVRFHDGTDFTAEAAKFNFDRMKTEPKSVRKGEVASIDSVDVVDSHTIKINLKRPDAALLATLTDRAGMMISPKVVQERGAELQRNAKGAGTGPFEYVAGSQPGGRYHTVRPWKPMGFGRVPEEDVKRSVPDEAIRTFTAPRGTVIFCNTSGLHRGGFAITRPRVLATATYCSPASLAALSQRNYTVDASLLSGLSGAGRYAAT